MRTLQRAGDSSSDVVKAHVSRLFFDRGLTKQEIAARLGISRFKVARLLDQAREEGIVQISIREPMPLDDELGRELERRFGLDLALVVRTAGEPEPVELVARVAAAWLPQLLGPNDVLGVAWGSTIQQVVRAIDSDAVPTVPVVQICGAIAGLTSGQGPAEVAWQLAEKLRGQYYALPVPAVVGSASLREDILENEAVKPTVAMFERVSLALVGIGSLVGEGRSSLLTSGYLRPDDMPELREQQAVGDLLVYLFDADGRFVSMDIATRSISLDLEHLRSAARVFAVAGGAGKEQAILGALRTGAVNFLTTDETNAAFALAHTS